VNARTIVSAIAQTIVTFLLFALAYRYGYWQAIAYLAVLCVASAAIVTYLWLKDPALLKRRIRGPQDEQNGSQKLVHSIVYVIFASAITLSCVDRGAGWSHVALPIVIAGDAIVAFGCAIYFIVFRANTLSASTVETAPGQTVIATGPYALVRHPMYVGLLCVLVGTPLALGSWWALLACVPMALAIASRIRQEERFLRDELPGYTTYAHRVRYRLLPFVW